MQTTTCAVRLKEKEEENLMGKKLETPLSPCFVLFVFKFFLLNSLSYLFVYSFVCLFVCEGTEKELKSLGGSSVQELGSKCTWSYKLGDDLIWIHTVRLLTGQIWLKRTLAEQNDGIV